MRILQVCPHFYGGGVGGVVEYVRNISERLAKQHDVTVFATDPRKKFPRFEVINGVKVERFYRLAPGKAYFFSLDMILRLRNSEFDVIHGHVYHAFPLHFSHIARHNKFIVSTHFHGVGHSAFRNSLIRLLKPFGELTIRKADKIIAVSDYEKKLLLEQFRISSDKIVVIPCGVNYKEFENLQKQKRNYRSILYVGRLDWYKGVHYLIEVLPMLDKDVHLEIVGKGFLEEFLKKRAKKLGVSDRVKFYKDLPRRQLLQLYKDADVFVLLSLYEAYSISVAEALSAGVPCIVSKTSALSEWIDEECVFGVELPIDLGKLANVILFVLNNRKVKNKNSKWLGSKIIDWDYVVKKLESIYVS
jgi:glycosyltransferase involved in cell wall biosynthesis